jgi:hypothetical protein
MNSTKQKTNQRQTQQSSAVQIRVVVEPGEVKRFDKLLEENHYLGDARAVGDYLRQVALVNGQWVALLTWGPAAHHLKDRDEKIGWTPRQRKERLKLVVQNRRFLLLGDKGEHPNRASQVLGASRRVLGAQWQEHFGYEPLVVETFSDPEGYEGTCYKAAGWEPVGFTAGYGRHRADFLVEHGRPKKLWMKELRPGGYTALRGADLPEECLAGQTPGHGALPVAASKLYALREALRQVPDPRAGHPHYGLGAVLSIVAMALLNGHRDIAEIVRFGQSLKPPQRAKLGLPMKRGTRFRQVPGYTVYYDVLRHLDLDAFAAVLSDWMARQNGSLPGALAMDGKMIRKQIGVLALVSHDSGEAVAVAPIGRKDGEESDAEMKVAQRLIARGPDLDGRMVTADALHCQKETARLLVERGGAYLLQIKKNQPKLNDWAQRAAAAAPFLRCPRNVLMDIW